MQSLHDLDDYSKKGFILIGIHLGGAIFLGIALTIVITFSVTSLWLPLVLGILLGVPGMFSGGLLVQKLTASR